MPSSARTRLFPAVVMLAVMPLAACGTTLDDGTGAAGAPQSLDGGTLVSTGGNGGSGGGSGSSGIQGAGGATGSGSSGSLTSPGGSNVVGGSGGSGSTGVQGTGGSAGSGSKSSQSANTAPIKIGVFYQNDAALIGAVFGSSAGSSASSAPTAGDVLQYLLKGLNAKYGGLAGRKIVPVVASLDSSQSSYASQYTAACQAFTQDNHVAAVVAQNHFDDGFASCLSKAGVPVLSETHESLYGDQQTLRTYPYDIAVSNFSADAHIRALLPTLAASKYLTAPHKLGVLVENCPFLDRAFNNTLVPLAKQLGISYDRQNVSCQTGVGDSGTSQSDAQSAIVHWRSIGVDRVMLLHRSEAATLAVFTVVADSQKWYPGWVVNTDDVPEVLVDGGLVSKAQAANMAGVGWNGSSGYDVPKVTGLPAAQLAAQKDCLALATAGGMKNASTASELVYQMCDPVRVLETTTKGSSGNINGPLIKSAVEALGSSMMGAWIGPLSFGQARHYGPTMVRPLAYQSSCSCFQYTGGFQRVE